MNSVEANPRPHTAVYDASMTGRPKAYYCRRCGRYVVATHVEDTEPDDQ